MVLQDFRLSGRSEGFPGNPPDIPRTEGIKYAGSKLRLLPYILDMAAETGCSSVFDAFSGSTRVSQAFAARGLAVTANDSAVYSKILNTAWLLNDRPPAVYAELIAHLNSLPPQRGWFTEHYGGLCAEGRSLGADGCKKPWQEKNTMKLDAVRSEIDRLQLDELTRAVCLTSLMLALDRVDNTMGHFASYLGKWSKRSYGDLHLTLPPLRINPPEKHTVLQADVFSAALHPSAVSAEAAYLDPPYGSCNDKMPPSRIRYRAYYHLWTTVCLNDRPLLTGRALRRKDAGDNVAPSVFEDFRKTPQGKYHAAEALDRLIRTVRCPLVILSYGSCGRIDPASLQEILCANGTLLRAEKINFRRHVMALMQTTRVWAQDSAEPNCEYLFLLRK